MTDTRLADVLDAVYDLLAADTTIAAAVTAGTLKLFDGPPTVDWSGNSMLVVGGLPVEDDESETSVTWSWGSSGRSGEFADVDEWIDIPCGISSVSGNSHDMRALRRTAIGLYAKAASALRASTLNIDVVMWCTSAASAIKQIQTPSGAECIIAFTARVRTRI